MALTIGCLRLQILFKFWFWEKMYAQILNNCISVTEFQIVGCLPFHSRRKRCMSGKNQLGVFPIKFLVLEKIIIRVAHLSVDDWFKM